MPTILTKALLNEFARAITIFKGRKRRQINLSWVSFSLMVGKKSQTTKVRVRVQLLWMSLWNVFARVSVIFKCRQGDKLSFTEIVFTFMIQKNGQTATKFIQLLLKMLQQLLWKLSQMSVQHFPEADTMQSKFPWVFFSRLRYRGSNIPPQP